MASPAVISRRPLGGMLAAAAACAAWLAACPAARSAVPDFNRDVRPILSRNCFACHGPDEHDRRGGLRLDDRDAALAETESGSRAIVPGKPAESELVARIHASDPDTVMPPPETNHVLTVAQKEMLERWIAAGAAYSPHWAFVPPRAHPEPERAGGDDAEGWPLNWIDSFVLADLAAERLAPAPEAGPVALIRRLHLDLTGIPPTPAEVDAFLRDPASDRYERAVDGLLASPRHAERLAAWWLDIVRYADTVGYHGDQEHHASPYRDWVIAAFLDNVPFDRFTVLQLSGDLVGPEGSEHPQDPVLASAYNRLLQTTHEGGLQLREYRAIYQADRIRNVSAAWMGATLGCAQCHDHKYDPYTTRDFYALGAFFADVDDEDHLRRGRDVTPTVRAPEITLVGPFDRAAAAGLDERIIALARGLPPLVETSATGPEPADHTARRAELAELRERRRVLDRRLMVTRSLAEPREVRILPRGNWMDDSGPLVSPTVPPALGALPAAGRPTRADLARWLVSPASAGGVGEFTARVTVNRIWALFFGAGLCRSLGDFGGQGELPDHPLLLDRLAIEFVREGWDVRRLVRLIVTSRAYRMSSDPRPELVARDPDNRLLARQSSWRLPAEHVRDTALAVSGLLVERLGGGSVRPYQPEGYYQHLSFPRRTYAADADERQWRRGLYVHWQRMFIHPQMLAFDAPAREECVAARARSNTPKAALVLLNDPTFVEAARKLAEQAVAAGGADDAARIDWLWRRALSRPPDPAERDLALGLLARRRAEYRDDPAAAEDLLGVGIAPRDTAIDARELASWAATARAVLNLHEAFARY